jgi:hypothetical protein
VATQLLVQLQHGFVATEVEQAIQRVLDVPDIATAGKQDTVDHRLVLARGLLLKIPHAPGEGTNRFVQGVVVTHD